MAIGFIPCKHGDEEEHEGPEGDLHSLSEVWCARQLAEALAVDKMLKDAYDAVLKEVRRYADQLAHLDPTNHNAAQEMGHVAVMLCNAETPQERLETLTHEAQRLMLAVANAKRECRVTWIISTVIVACGVCAAVVLLT